jgi:hypothetical protein
VPVVVDEVHHRHAVDPFAPMQRRGGEPGDHALTSGPQPSGPRPQRGSNVCVPTDVHISEQPDIASTQPTSGQGASGDGLTAKERLTHDGSVARVTRSVTSVVDGEVAFTVEPEREINFTLGRNTSTAQLLGRSAKSAPRAPNP